MYLSKEVKILNNNKDKLKKYQYFIIGQHYLK